MKGRKSMSRRDKYFRLTVLSSLLLLGFMLWVTDDQEETPGAWRYAEIVELMNRGALSPYDAAKLIRLANTNVYHLLIDEMKVQDSYARKSYIAAYPKLPEFLKTRLNSPLSDADRRDRALYILQDLLGTEADVNKVVDMLGSDRPEVRHAACRALYFRRWSMTVKKDERWPQDKLLNHLASQDEVVRDFNLHLFAEIGAKTTVAQTNFTRFLSHPDEEVALDATGALLAMGGDTNQVKPVLQKLVGSATDAVRYEAAVRLKGVDDGTKSMAVFMSLAQSTNTPYRLPALSQLSFCEHKAAAYSPAVKVLFTDPDPQVREAATNTFYSITPDAGTGVLQSGITYYTFIHNGSRYTRKHLRL